MVRIQGAQEGSNLGAWGSGFRVQGSGVGCRVQGLRGERFTGPLTLRKISIRGCLWHQPPKSELSLGCIEGLEVYGLRPWALGSLGFGVQSFGAIGFGI